jgi:hypothetical protein
MTIDADQLSKMLNPDQSAELLRIVDSIREFHDSLPEVAIIPTELVELFELVPVLCEAMAFYSLASLGHGSLTAFQ